MAGRPAARAAPSRRMVPSGGGSDIQLPQGADEDAGQLKKSGQVTLDSNGNGTIGFHTDHAWQRWEVTSIVVSTSQSPTSTPVPSAEAFVNTVNSRGNSEGGTASGNQDTLSGLVNVSGVDTLNVRFTGGISGTTAYAVVTGTKYTRRS